MRVRTFALVLLGLTGAAWADSTIVSSKHDLSVSGGGKIRSATETRVCVFCHVGHGQKPGGDNRPDLRTDYVPYQSSTLTSVVPSTPTGASRVCLSCHDGTIALGETVASGTIDLLNTGAGGRLPEGPSNLGTDLRRTHPVSFVPAPSEKLRLPEKGEPVHLDARGQVQCTACHDPHLEDLDPARRMFLVGSNRGSALCLTCHQVQYWKTNPSAHQSSTVLVDRSRTSVEYPYPTVAENGCESCHQSHAASEHGRLVRGKGDEAVQQVCLDCHNGRVAKTDLARELAKSFAHTLPPNTPDVHDAAESPQNPRAQLPERRSSAPRHVTCVDCHNPHAAYDGPTPEGLVPSALAGVWGIDFRGERVEQARFEYEVCFKCHGDSANQPRSRPSGALAPRRGQQLDPNLRLAFAPDAPSAHPVVQPNHTHDSPSLKAPYNATSLIRCTDCHSSDAGPGAGGQGAKGPHGSSYDFLLERNYSVADGTAESPLAYALCYKCHDREVLLSRASAFPSHAKHVVDSATPCSACHTAHGASALQGTPQGNAHLVDFDTNIVGPGKGGAREYQSRGGRAGTCSVSCHGVVHDSTGY